MRYVSCMYSPWQLCQRTKSFNILRIENNFFFTGLEKCSQIFNQSFETGGRTVFKVGVGFQILPQGKAGMIQNNFKVLVILKYFKVLAGLRSQFEYSTSDFTGITMPSCIKIKRLAFGSPFQKALGL